MQILTSVSRPGQPQISAPHPYKHENRDCRRGGTCVTDPKAAVCEESYQNHASSDDRAPLLKPCDDEREARDEHGDGEG